EGRDGRDPDPGQICGDPLMMTTFDIRQQRLEPGWALFRICLLASILCSILFALSFAASVQSGASFLQIDAAARPASWAGAYAGAPGDIDSLSYNPGALALLGRRQL